MDCNDHSIYASLGILNAVARQCPLGLLIALALITGCGEPSLSSHDSLDKAQTGIGESTGPCVSSQLMRVAPPNLVQLTDFAVESPNDAGKSLGPHLASPQKVAARSESPSAAESVLGSAGGEIFSILDEPGTTPNEHPSHDRPPRSGRLTSGSVLPWGPSTPSPEMTAIAQRAEQIARRGYELAQRGGLYSARARFTEALRITTEALDAQRSTDAHTHALAAGLRAMEEVDDFVPRTTQIESSINLPLIIDAHRTPVLKNRSLDGITPLVAQRLYLTYAQEQLAMAGADQAVASLALHGLGKICTTPAQMHGPHTQIAEAKAVVYFQAAVIIEPRNFMSANELGVLLARFGQWHDARQALEQAAAKSNSPTSWNNLAIVNERLGDAQKAKVCRERSEMAVAQSTQKGTSGNSPYPVRWVDPETFAQSNAMAPNTTPNAAQAKAQQSLPMPSTAAQPTTKSNGWKWPWQ